LPDVAFPSPLFPAGTFSGKKFTSALSSKYNHLVPPPGSGHDWAFANDNDTHVKIATRIKVVSLLIRRPGVVKKFNIENGGLNSITFYEALT